jgi:hypothetical protein
MLAQDSLGYVHEVPDYQVGYGLAEYPDGSVAEVPMALDGYGGYGGYGSPMGLPFLAPIAAALAPMAARILPQAAQAVGRMVGGILPNAMNAIRGAGQLVGSGINAFRGGMQQGGMIPAPGGGMMPMPFGPPMPGMPRPYMPRPFFRAPPPWAGSRQPCPSLARGRAACTCVARPGQDRPGWCPHSPTSRFRFRACPVHPACPARRADAAVVVAGAAEPRCCKADRHVAYQYPQPPRLGQACALHERFFGHSPDRIERARVEAAPPRRVLVELGELRALVYRAARDGRSRNYVHFFEQPPRLLADAQGQRLFIDGGHFRVTRQGIEG